jgi:FkbM family methyltransferase
MRGPSSAYRRMRHAVRCAMGRDLRFEVQTRVPFERHGDEGGAWCIDPRGLGAESIVYSIGIGTEITFDLSLIAVYGVTVHAFDPTPGAIEYVRQRQLPSRYRWHPVGVGRYDGEARFFPPANPAHISHSLLHRAETSDTAIQVEIRRVSTIMRDLGHTRLDVLKMDIEGAEYDVLDDVLDQRLAIRQILVEFHHRFPGVGLDSTRRAVGRLNAAGYRIFFVSDNGEEYSVLSSC